MICRGCGNVLKSGDAFCNLGAQPLANELLSELDHAQVHYPLRPLICWHCSLVQLPVCPPPQDIFTPAYPFFAGQSVSWLKHCKELATEATAKFELSPTSRVLDIGSNDGTLLRAFRGRGIPALGVEPCAEVAQHAAMEGLSTICDWWDTDLAQRLMATKGTPTAKSWRADLVVCTNVLAHVPDLLGFLTAVKLILAPHAVVLFEVPYLGSLVREGQFDQIYAEHHSYFSLHSLRVALERAGLRMCSVDWLDTHGGSMRVTADGGYRTVSDTLHQALEAESAAGHADLESLKQFAAVPRLIKQQAWHRLSQLKGKRVVGYGASAKAAVTLNYLGAGPEIIEFVADITSAKWNKYLPGCRIPVLGPQQLREAQPDVVINFCWNWKEESEGRIREACPDAQILYLNQSQPILRSVA